MFKSKKYNKIVIYTLVLFVVITCFSACSNKDNTNTGFIIKDGEETYVIDGVVYGNRLVNVDNKLYYVDENGHKVKSNWAVIDNDGHLGYFGDFGELITDKIRTIDGKDYYFDENGILYQDRTEKQIITINDTKYIADKDGVLKMINDETEKAETTTNKTTTQQKTTVSNDIAIRQSQIAELEKIIASKQAIIDATREATTLQTTAQITEAQVSNEAPTNKKVNITNTAPVVGEDTSGPGMTNSTKTNSKVSSSTNQTTTQTTTQASSEIKITSTEKVTDEIDGDEYSCQITLLRPIMNGADVEETENMNNCISELMDAWFDEINGLVSDYDDLPKSITFSNASLGTVSKSKIYINITGSLKTKSGASKSLKYRITYDREDINADIDQVN